MTNPERISRREIFVTRMFDVPTGELFASWIDPERTKRWIGPRGYTATKLEADVRPGGQWRLCLTPNHGEDELWQGGTYREIVMAKRLVFTFAWRRHYETLVTVTFASQGNQTRLAFRQTRFESLSDRDGHLGGWTSSFDRLEAYLSAQKQAA